MKRQRLSLFDYLEEQWTCSITGEPMKDPVITEDGHSYERAAIQKWLTISHTSPKTGLRLFSISLINNIDLKNIIQRFNNQTKYELAKILEINQELIERLDNYKQAFMTINSIKSQVESQNQFLRKKVQESQQKYLDLLLNYKQLEIKHNILQKKLRSSKLSSEARFNELIMQNERLRGNSNKMFQDIFQNQEKDQNYNCQFSEQIILQVSKKEYEQSVKLQVKQKSERQKDKKDKKLQSMRNQQQKDTENCTYNESLFRLKLDDKYMKFSPQKNLLPFNEYIKRNPVQYDQKEKELDHMEWPIKMEKFLKYDWRQCRTFKFSKFLFQFKDNCRIDDMAFSMFLSEADNFSNLENLFLEDNRIINVPKFSLEQFKNLKRISFCQQPGKQNPLSKNTLQYLNDLKKKHYLINVSF